jgi:hypothetical protein
VLVFILLRIKGPKMTLLQAVVGAVVCAIVHSSELSDVRAWEAEAAKEGTSVFSSPNLDAFLQVEWESNTEVGNGGLLTWGYTHHQLCIHPPCIFPAAWKENDRVQGCVPA